MAERNIGIGPDGLKVGNSIEVGYENPRSSPGAIHINLLKDDNNYVLHFNPRWGPTSLVLNTKENGKFGDEKKVDGYNFKYGATMFVKFTAESDHFIINVYTDTVNKATPDMTTRFYYRGLDNTIIKRVSFRWIGDPAGAEPISMHVGYK